MLVLALVAAGVTALAFLLFVARRQGVDPEAVRASDPLLAATIMAASLARMDGTITTAHHQVLRRHLTLILKLQVGHAEEVIAEALDLTEGDNRPELTFQAQVPLLDQNLGHSERHQLVAFMQDIAGTENGGLNQAQERCLNRLSRQLLGG